MDHAALTKYTEWMGVATKFNCKGCKNPGEPNPGKVKLFYK